jgi:hypothetical protein
MDQNYYNSNQQTLKTNNILPALGGRQESPCHRISLLLRMQHETQHQEKPQAY